MIKIGRIYKERTHGRLTRIFKSSGGGGKDGLWAGRGCTKETAVPYNHYHGYDLIPATMEEVNTFLELEMQNGMAQTTNKIT